MIKDTHPKDSYSMLVENKNEFAYEGIILAYARITGTVDYKG